MAQDAPAKATTTVFSDDEPPIHGMRVGWVAGVDADGSVRIDFPANKHGPLLARTTVPLEPEQWQQAARERREVTLFFDDGRPSRPVLTGLLQPMPPTPLLDAMLAQRLPMASREAQVDGRRVLLEGRDEVVLRCGKATLILRADGRVILRGVEVLTEAEGVHRIRGGKVKIN
ncbi:hypothetical protein A176_005989 [Myxococcus hansupus]|uniref:DUF6484 domain-containing protein n=1 Tax=Pseudomyxococcus hansupus TaxID=1297742 RepID=A0A0H4XLE4_9BACT|nr:DUF6484 domain-containing protein [Myxococcus hansupus]AKQ69077.1 hypothetical protein A176_005989 [Myxococcus hansupus]